VWVALEGRHGIAVTLGQHRGIGNHIGHGGTDAAVVRRDTGLEHFRDILLRPIADAARINIRKITDPFGTRAASKLRFGFDTAESIPGRVTFGAMPERFNEIMAPVPRVAPGRLRPHSVHGQNEDISKIL
jgi:hypothetical protein